MCVRWRRIPFDIALETGFIFLTNYFVTCTEMHSTETIIGSQTKNQQAYYYSKGGLYVPLLLFSYYRSSFVSTPKTCYHEFPGEKKIGI